MTMKLVDDPFPLRGVSMSAIRFIAALCIAFTCASLTSAQEPSAAWLKSMGLANLEMVTADESMEVRGQGFSSGVSRSASALPGTYTYNLAQAQGINFAKTLSSSLSELDIYVSSNPSGGHGSFQDYLTPDHPFSGYGPVMNGSHAVGASGFSVSSSN
jgi:hypothetical protein